MLANNEHTWKWNVYQVENFHLKDIPGKACMSDMEGLKPESENNRMCVRSSLGNQGGFCKMTTMPSASLHAVKGTRLLAEAPEHAQESQTPALAHS